MLLVTQSIGHNDPFKQPTVDKATNAEGIQWPLANGKKLWQLSSKVA
jgi:hypothetical protein